MLNLLAFSRIIIIEDLIYRLYFIVSLKGLLWMGNGFLLLYKRFESGTLSWPRTSEEAAELTEEQFHYLMLGLNPLNPKIQ